MGFRVLLLGRMCVTGDHPAQWSIEQGAGGEHKYEARKTGKQGGVFEEVKPTRS